MRPEQAEQDSAICLSVLGEALICGTRICFCVERGVLSTPSIHGLDRLSTACELLCHPVGQTKCMIEIDMAICTDTIPNTSHNKPRYLCSRSQHIHVHLTNSPKQPQEQPVS